jgi:LPS sulfotransferase NodH
MFAPVVISVYTRLAHFKNAIDSLKKNSIANKSNLIIYSDAASRQEDIEPVQKVREYAKKIVGFRTVTVIERPVNYGGVNNAFKGVLQVIRIFKRAIFIEDDIETAPGFLMFMNEALDFYNDNQKVISITGYSPPLNISEYISNDFFVMNRFCGWGSGLYERTAVLLSKQISQVEFDDLHDKNILCEFGQDVLEMVKKEVAGELDAADVRCMFHQAVGNLATIYPRNSLVQNCGHDGTGYHCGKTKRFQHLTLWKKTENFEFSDNLNIDPRIQKEQQDFRAFRGDYEIHRTLYNQKQSKEVALNYISSLFKKDLAKISVSEKAPQPKSCKVAILSTPRVGSTWLSYLLYPYFGESIRREWLHNRFLQAFVDDNPSFTAEQYLSFLKDRAFADSTLLGLHIHINQIRAWKQNYGIDIIDFFDFDHVVYMERENMFEQTYSLAVATESGLWGNEIIDALNFSENFKVKVSQDAFVLAYNNLLSEKAFYSEHLKDGVTDVIRYEELKKAPTSTLQELFERKYKFTPTLERLAIVAPEKSHLIVSEENKTKLKSFYESNYPR